MSRLSKSNPRAAGPTAKSGAKAVVVAHPRRITMAAELLREQIVQASLAMDQAVASGDKGYLRAVHVGAKQFTQQREKANALFTRHQRHFKIGAQIDPAKIDPVLMPVGPTGLWADLFFVTRSMWSMPYNKGYGRRLRYVVYDSFHESVIGIIGLQSPPADLGVRDRLFDCPEENKLALVNATMDAYAVGAVPPYSFLLGGKLCAGLIATDTIRQGYWRQYAGKQTEMEQAHISQPLVGVTTTSAFGRSSQYNRLKYKERLLAQPIGYTQGYGMLHLEHVYEHACNYLRMIGKYIEPGYGNGPKVRWQNMTRALLGVGLPSSMLKHGVLREVFLYRFVDNFEQGMKGGAFGAPLNLPEADFACYWKERWALPRAARFPSWNQGDEHTVMRRALNAEPTPAPQ
jgi:hypothetical protein